MTPRLPGAALLALVAGGALAQDRSPPATLEQQCRREVERRFPPGSLSRGRQERQRLIEACIANGGRLP